MKLGVFGDSFAEDKPGIWWKHLQTPFGHTVDNYAEAHTGILYSAKIIEKKASEYDIAIWCVSSPGRMSVRYSGDLIHLPSRLDHTRYSVVKHAYEAYLSYLYNNDDDIFVCNALVESIINKHKNIMILPCFSDPIYSNDDAKGFNLFQVSAMEVKNWFPHNSLHNLWVTHKDLRPGHITANNQIILAKLINDNLIPGIFQTDYNNFKKPVGPTHIHITPYDFQSHQTT